MAKRLGDLLIEEGIIQDDQLGKAIEEQQKTGEPLGRILVQMNYITEEALYYFQLNTLERKLTYLNLLNCINKL